jgi:hypothetical protein
MLGGTCLRCCRRGPELIPVGLITPPAPGRARKTGDEGEADVVVAPYARNSGTRHSRGALWQPSVVGGRDDRFELRDEQQHWHHTAARRESSRRPPAVDAGHGLRHLQAVAPRGRLRCAMRAPRSDDSFSPRRTRWDAEYRASAMPGRHDAGGPRSSRTDPVRMAPAGQRTGLRPLVLGVVGTGRW